MGKSCSSKKRGQRGSLRRGDTVSECGGEKERLSQEIAYSLAWGAQYVCGIGAVK